MHHRPGFLTVRAQQFQGNETVLVLRAVLRNRFNSGTRKTGQPAIALRQTVYDRELLCIHLVSPEAKGFTINLHQY